MERTKPIKVYAYTRVSTGMQVDAYSLDAQLSSIKKYCEYKGYEIVHHYSDRGISGKDIKHRIEFRQMMTDIASNKDGVSYVIVFKLSRFGRNTENVLNALKFLQAHEVALACSEENIDSSNEMSNFIITIMAAVAELERENILIQTQAGRRQKAIEGKWNGGPAPYGYSLTNGKLEINEEQAPLIRRIFEIFYDNELRNTESSEQVYRRRVQERQYAKSRLFLPPHLIPNNSTLCNKGIRQSSLCRFYSLRKADSSTRERQ